MDTVGNTVIEERISETAPLPAEGGRFLHEWLVAGMLLVLDVACWAALYAISTMARGDSSFATTFQFFFLEGVQLAVIVGALFVIGGYNRHTEMRGLSYATEHVLALLVAGLVCAMVVYSAATFDHTMKPSRSVLLVSFVVFLPLSLLYRRSFRKAISASTAGRKFLVIGAGELAAEFYQTFQASVNREQLEFVGPDGERTGEHIAGPDSPVIRGDLGGALDRLDASYSGVILAEEIQGLKPALLERLARTQFQKVRVYTLESFHEAHWRHLPVHSIDPFWPLQTGFQLARSSPYHYAKRLFDIVLASVLLVLAAPFVAAIALRIRLGDGGPVIFRQPRVGRHNAPFTVLKFRTMRLRNADCGVRNAESQGAPVSSPPEGRGADAYDPSEAEELDAKCKGVSMTGVSEDADQSAIRNLRFAVPDDDIYTRANDPRITPNGRFLRKSRLDELPQLWNVFRGEMSMIGPRAEWTKCAERYEKVIPFYHFRHLVKPGITGWAQVNYPYGESEQDAIEKLKYDLYYIRNYSLKLDLMIVFKTVYTVLFGKGR